jgi:hypothetical protein
MRKKIFLLWAFLLALGHGAPARAQAPNDFIQLFGGVVRQAMRQAAQAEWQRLPTWEISCLNENLRSQGSSVPVLVSRGVSPSDPRLAELRSRCRNSSSAPVASAPTPVFPYVVDGLALGASVRFESAAYKEYHCSPSEKFPGFTWCHKEKVETTRNGEVTSANSILHGPDGTSFYINRYIEPAFFGPTDVRTEIDRLSAKYAEPAREFQMPSRSDLPNAIIAVWGKLALRQLTAGEVASVASGGSHEGILISFLGDLQRSAKAGAPIYELAGGPGFAWAAAYNAAGKGVLRFLAADASSFDRTISRPAEGLAPSSLGQTGPLAYTDNSRAHLHAQPPRAFPSLPTSEAGTTFTPLSQQSATRTVEVTASGDTSEAAEKEAARQAVQQVAGVFIDDRRLVQTNMSDKQVNEIVEEKLLSYTNAYVTELVVTSSNKTADGYTIKARITVAVAPLLKTLQSNNVPTAPFDSTSAAATAETLSEQKTKALEIYKDLLGRLTELVQLGVGKAQVDPSLPSAPNSAWISVPITFFANKVASDEWRNKLSLIADHHARLPMLINQASLFGQCRIPHASVSPNDTAQTFFARPPSYGQFRIAACFASDSTQNGIIVDCFAKDFIGDQSATGGRRANELAFSTHCPYPVDGRIHRQRRSCDPHNQRSISKLP